MEERGRTEEQIKTRVKKLGLTKVSKSPPSPSPAMSYGVVEQSDGQDGQEYPDQEKLTDEDEGRAGDRTITMSARLHKMEKRGQESDADSEGLFSSVEVNLRINKTSPFPVPLEMINLIFRVCCPSRERSSSLL